MFNRSAASTLETFTFTQTAPDGWVAIKAKTNGKYLMANKSDANAPLLACSDNWLYWECFKVYKQNGNYYIKAQATNKWLCVRVDRNGAPVWAMADVPSTWERLDIKVVSTNKNNDIILNVKPVFQSTSNTCSGAAALAVLQYNGKATNKTDKDIYGSVQGIVANSVSTLNSYLGAGTYKWSTCGTLENYEKTIRASLSQNAPVIVRVKFPKGYFNYGSSGHHTTIIGIYTDDSGKVWLKIADSYVNRYNGNNYCNKDTGIVHVPLDVMFDYGDYGNTSPVYVIHHK